MLSIFKCVHYAWYDLCYSLIKIIILIWNYHFDLADQLIESGSKYRVASRGEYI